MQLLTAHDLSLDFVTEEIFRDVAFSVSETSHIGLVGANGAGKTSLFKLIIGQLTPSSGGLSRSRDCRLSYMEQFLDANEDDSLYQAVLNVFAPLIALEQRLEEVNARLLVRADDKLVAEQSRLQEEYAAQDGYAFRSRVRGALLGLGFTEQDMQLPISALSGGQRSKAALAKVLLTPAELMLLDEPTNHLDVESIQWLENYLVAYKGAFILISHDRYFLDKATNETWALHHHRLRRYAGNYSAHVQQRREEEDSLRHRFETQMKEIRRIEAIIEQQRRFNQARNYITIASKEKQLARLREELVLPESNERTLSFRFNTPPPGGNDVLELHGVSKSFGPRRLFTNVELHVNKGERVFLLGPNGCGKSTLMKIIMGQQQADRGMCRLGVNVIPAYYDQLHGHLSGPQSVLQHFTDAYPRLTQTEIRTMLGTFLFPGDTANKTLDMLSGGEKARLELMKLILEPANFLLLDEPTNHLDISGMEAVEQALSEYPGSLLIVSHDRYLVNKLADKIYWLSEDGLQVSLGNYDNFLEQQARRSADKAEPTAPAAEKNEYQRRKEEQAAARKLARQQEKLAAAIAESEAELERIDAQMNDPALAADYQRLMELQQSKEAAEERLLSQLEEQEQSFLSYSFPKE